MSNSTQWRELHRTSDLHEAVAVVTSIAAMEFDVRCIALSSVDGAERSVVALHQLDDVQGPIVIEVAEGDHAALGDVLDEILAEQAEFDAKLDGDRPWTLKQCLLSAVAIAGVAITVWLAFMPR